MDRKIKKDIRVEMRGGNWEEIQENRKWENRDGWRLLCNSRPIFGNDLRMMIMIR